MKGYTIILLFILSSCGIKTFYLKDSTILKAPLNPRKYVKEVPFDKSLNQIIDCNSLYQSLKNEPISGSKEYYCILRFYSNGCFNIFLKNQKEKLLTSKMLDPEYHGYRGYYNRINSEIIFDKFGEINQMREFGKLSGTFIVKGDTIYMYNKNPTYLEVFVRKKVSHELLDFNANW